MIGTCISTPSTKGTETNPQSSIPCKQLPRSTMNDELTSVVVATEDDPSFLKPTDISTLGSNRLDRRQVGKLRCRTRGDKSYCECRLDVDKELRCQLVELLDGHVHGPNCGHEMVKPQMHPKESQSKKYWKHSHKAPTGDDDYDATEPLLVECERSDSTNLVTTTIHAAGICCPSEEPIIKGLLKDLPGVKSVDVIVLTKNVKVVHNASQMPSTVILSALNEAGLQASIGRKGEESSASIFIPWHVILSGICMGVAMVSVFFEELDYLKFVALGAVLCGCPYILLRAFASLKQFRLDINILMLISAGGAISISEYLEAGAIVFLFGLSEWLEDTCMGKARSSINFLLEMQADVAISATTKKPVPIDKVEVDDLLIVRPGDRIPVDGEVVAGETAVDESLLTGESKPISKLCGDKVVSGTLNSGYGSLTIRATKTAEQSTVALLASNVESASMQKSRAGLLVDKFARYYTPAVVILALCLTLVPLALGLGGLVDTHRTEREWLYLSLVLLVCACPCALVLSTPVVSVCGISRAARQSVLIKGGQYLEALAHIKSISFDKTGTLTEGHFGIVDIQAFRGSEMEVLRMVASLELHSTHPLGPAIVGSAAARGISAWAKASQIDTVAGKGIRGMIDGKLVSVGNLSLMAEDAASSKIPNVTVGASGSLCYLAVDGEVVGAIVVSDTARPDAVGALAKLKSMGLVLGMLTGDRWQTAKYVGKELGVLRSHTHAELLPSDKLDLVSEYHDTFKVVAHVGDGINDALALARADVGIAMGVGGAALAVDAADVALFSNDLMAIPFVIGLARSAFWIQVQNLVFAVVLKVTVILLAAFGYVALWEAVLADVGSSLLVTLNGLRLLAYQRKLAPKPGCKRVQKHSHKGTTKESHCCANSHSKQSDDYSHGHGNSSWVQTLQTKGCCGSKQPKSIGKACCRKTSQGAKEHWDVGNQNTDMLNSKKEAQCHMEQHECSGPTGCTTTQQQLLQNCSKNACCEASTKEDTGTCGHNKQNHEEKRAQEVSNSCKDNSSCCDHLKI